ncbi:MAG: Ig-like domain-containing protein [Candidatus Ozemobacteraceae bacterium]
MKKAFSLLVICGLLLTVVLVGCGGSGGGGGNTNPLTPADSSAITLTLRNFMAALAGNDKAAAGRFLSAKAQTESSQGILTVWDFGNNVANQNDNASYTFIIPSDGIILVSDMAAMVSAFYVLEGKRLDLRFDMLRDQGVWYIEGFSFSEKGYFSYFPLHYGDQWKFKKTTGTSAQPAYTLEVVNGPETVSGIQNVYTMVGSAPIPAVASTRSTVRGALDFFSRNGRNRYSTHDGLWCLGPVTDARYEFNGGKPWLILPADAVPETSYPASLTEKVDGTVFFIDANVVVHHVVMRPTLLGLKSAMPVEITLTYKGDGARTIKEMWYLADNFGLVGFDSEVTRSGQVSEISHGEILEARVNGQVFQPTETGTSTGTGTGTNTNTSTSTGTSTGTGIALSISTTSPITVPWNSTPPALMAQGGVPPYAWSVPATSILPPGISSINASTGAFVGVANATGTYVFSVILKDSANHLASGSFSMVVNTDLIFVDPYTLPSAVVFASYSHYLAVTGATGSVTWSVDPSFSLPSFLTLNATDGLLAGIPTSVMPMQEFKINVVDSVGKTGTAYFGIDVILPSPTPTPIPSPTPTPVSPTVTSADPVSGATNVALNIGIAVTFSEAMDPLTISSTTFSVKEAAGTSVDGTVTYLGLIATFTPTGILAANTLYTATISTGAKNLTGIPLATNYTWNFSTVSGPTPTPTPTPVPVATGVMSVFASRDSNNANQILLSFKDTSSNTLSIDAASVNAKNFFMFETLASKTGGIAVRVAKAPNSVVAAANGLTLVFNAGDLNPNAPDWGLIASGVRSSDQSYTCATGAVTVGNRPSFQTFYSWDWFRNGAPLPTRILAPIGDSIFLIYPDGITEVAVTLGTSGGNPTISLNQNPAANKTWFTGTSPKEVRDMLHITTATETFLLALCTDPSTGNSEIASMSPLESTTRIDWMGPVASYGRLFDLFEFNDTVDNPYSRGFVVAGGAAGSENFQSVSPSWLYPSLPFTSAISYNIAAMDSSNPTVNYGANRFLANDGNLYKTDLASSGLLVNVAQLTSGLFSNPAGKFGIVWLDSWLSGGSGLDKYFVADGNSNKVNLLQESGTSGNLIFTIGGTAGMEGNAGYPKNPFSLCVVDMTTTGAVSTTDLWLVVADTDGLTIYRNLP